MIRGGVCILDEANRMSEKSWASLAPLLDTRRYIESIVAGLKVSAHPDFRICVTMNDDASTFEIPGVHPQSLAAANLSWTFLKRRKKSAFCAKTFLLLMSIFMDYVVNFLQGPTCHNENYTVRDGINIARYAAKRIKSLNGNRGNVDNLLRQAILMTLGDEALMHIL